MAAVCRFTWHGRAYYYHKLTESRRTEETHFHRQPTHQFTLVMCASTTHQLQHLSASHLHHHCRRLYRLLVHSLDCLHVAGRRGRCLQNMQYFQKKDKKKRARPVSKTEEINGQTIKADLHQRTMGKFVKPFLKPFVLPQQFDFLFVTFVKKVTVAAIQRRLFYECLFKRIYRVAQKRGHPISLQIFWKLHDWIAWKLVNFCNIICWTQSLTFCLKISSRCGAT